MRVIKTYTRIRRRLCSALIAFVMTTALFPALSQTVVNAETTYNGTQSPLTLSSGTYILSNVTIPATNEKAGITIDGTVVLKIVGTNTICGGHGKTETISNKNVTIPGYAGIYVPSGSSLDIQGTGILNATGGNAANGGNGLSGMLTDGIGGGGAGAGIGGNGGTGGDGANGGTGETSGRIAIDDAVTIYATGGNGGAGGTGAAHMKSARMGGGGGGYPAAGIGGGGAGGGAGNGGGGGGGYSGGGGSTSVGGQNGAGGAGGTEDWSGSRMGGGGGYFSVGTDGYSANQYGGAIGGGGGSRSTGTVAYSGGIAGNNSAIIVRSTAKITAVNGGDTSHGSITFNRGANQPVSGIGAGAGYTEPASGSYISASPPSAPNAPSVSPDNGRVTISWSAPAANGAAITNYEVFQNGTSIGTTSSTTMTKTGLQNGTSYSYTVRAYNAAGWGNTSAAASAIPRTVPNAPTTPSVAPGDGENTISWTAPAANGAAITNYEVFQDGVSIGTTTLTSMTKTGLTNGINYSYSVRAYNVAGWGALSPSTASIPFGLPDQ